MSQSWAVALPKHCQWNCNNSLSALVQLPVASCCSALSNLVLVFKTGKYSVFSMRKSKLSPLEAQCIPEISLEQKEAMFHSGNVQIHEEVLFCLAHFSRVQSTVTVFLLYLRCAFRQLPSQQHFCPVHVDSPSLGKLSLMRWVPLRGGEPRLTDRLKLCVSYRIRSKNTSF